MFGHPHIQGRLSLLPLRVHTLGQLVFQHRPLLKKSLLPRREHGSHRRHPRPQHRHLLTQGISRGPLLYGPVALFGNAVPTGEAPFKNEIVVEPHARL